VLGSTLELRTTRTLLWLFFPRTVWTGDQFDPWFHIAASSEVGTRSDSDMCITSLYFADANEVQTRRLPDSRTCDYPSLGLTLSYQNVGGLSGLVEESIYRVSASLSIPGDDYLFQWPIGS